MKEQDHTLGQNLNEVEVSHFPDQGYRTAVMRVLTKLGKEWMDTARTSAERQKM